MIEKVARTEFLKNVTHKPLKLNPSKNPRLPSPRVEKAPGRDAKITEEGATHSDQPRTGPQVATGMTGARRSTSPLRKILNFIFGMCKSQHDIQVSNKGLGGQTSK
jgi:hypothetical protein